MHTYLLIAETKKLLGSLDKCLQKAVDHAAAKKYDPVVLLDARLAPDMFPLARQIQATCDTAKFAAARVSGKEPPAHPDTERTIDEIRARIAAVIGYLDGFVAADFDAADRRISLPRWEGRSMSATDYLVEHGLPNFYFHLSMSYAILRHNGVDIGKRDYLGALTMT